MKRMVSKIQIKKIKSGGKKGIAMHFITINGHMIKIKLIENIPEELNNQIEADKIIATHK